MRKNKLLSCFVIVLLAMSFVTTPAYAIGMKEASSSLFLPTTGQAMNNQLGHTKTKVMAGVEVAALTTVAILGTAVGGGVVWAGIGPLIANHLWSSVDAYHGAQGRIDPFVQQQMTEAQKTLEMSRQNRFNREEARRSDIRERISQAGEEAYNR